jgi:hypothetical protein
MNLRIIEDTDDLLLLELAGSLILKEFGKSKLLSCSRDLAKRPVILDFSQVRFLARSECGCLKHQSPGATREAARHPRRSRWWRRSSNSAA